MNLQELRQKYAGLCDQQQAIITTAVNESRAMNETEKASFEVLQTQIDTLDNTIKAAEAVQSRATALDAPADPVIRPASVQVGEDRAANRPFANLGEQILSVIAASRPGAMADSRLLRIQAAASGLNEGVPSEGGFLVQQDFAAAMLEAAYQTGILASRCRSIPLSASSNGVKIPGIDEKSRADGSRYGGIRAYWEGEADTITATKPKFRLLDLKLRKLTGACYLTDELIQDTVALAAWVSEAFAGEFGFKLDDAIVNGTGAGQPLGFMNAPALIVVAKENGQAADSIEAKNIVKMWSRVPARNRANAVWMINQDIEPELYLLSLPVGTGGVPVYMPANGLAGQPYSTLFGRPVIPAEQAATLGDQGDISVVDLSQYLLTDKRQMEAAQSIHVRFLEDEQVLRFIYRVDGQPAWSSAITPYKGSNTISPFVTLAARA